MNKLTSQHLMIGFALIILALLIYLIISPCREHLHPDEKKIADEIKLQKQAFMKENPSIKVG